MSLPVWPLPAREPPVPRKGPRSRDLVCRDEDEDEMEWNRGPGGLRLLALTLALLLVWTTLLRQALTQELRPGERIASDVVVAMKDFFIGPCLVKTNRSCPDEEVGFFLHTREGPEAGERLFVDGSGSNLAQTSFAPEAPTKIVVHGYNSDMNLDSLVEIRREYLKREPANVIAVDWRRLAAGPCYPVAVHNVPHVGECLAQLVGRLRDAGAWDIHAIGFSLGAHVPAYCANQLRPYKLPRITGLDPAMPLFVTVGKDEKLDAGDAEFVDVFHTNAFVQGKVEASGHVDFYMNGGINQPGCWEKRNPFGCNHHRAAMYFAESINTRVGFWGWPCPGFLAYLLGLCPPRFPAVLAGEHVDSHYRGFYLVKTRAASPFAEGLFAVEPGYQLNL